MLCLRNRVALGGWREFGERAGFRNGLAAWVGLPVRMGWVAAESAFFGRLALVDTRAWAGW